MAEFILMGDTGSGYKEQYLVAKSLEQHLKKHSKIKSIMIVGDNIYPNGCHSVSDNQFNEKFQIPYQNIKLPFYLCLGNHDYGTMISNYSETQIQYTFSEYNTDKKWNMPSKWYTQSFPNCDFFFIDTNFEWLSESSIQKQLRDTIQSIKQSKGKWKVLCGHHTWRSVGGHGNAEKRHEIFMNDLLKQVKIDLYVCGHDHCKSIIEVGTHKIPTLVIGTGGKEESDELFYPKNLDKDNSILYFYSPNLGVCHMKCSNNSLHLLCYNEKLEEEYKYTIRK
jgi:tartrate-resistant acid phosphatase type 5